MLKMTKQRRNKSGRGDGMIRVAKLVTLQKYDYKCCYSSHLLYPGQHCLLWVPLDCPDGAAELLHP